MSSRRSKARRREFVLVVLAVTLAAVAVNWLLWRSPLLRPIPPEEAQRLASKEVPDDDEALPPEIEEMLAAPYYPSLEAKEQADFLLTPALLVEELLAGDGLVTYPNE